MILDIVLSIAIVLGGAQSPSGDFNQCPPSSDTQTVSAPQTTTTTTTAVKQSKK